MASTCARASAAEQPHKSACRWWTGCWSGCSSCTSSTSPTGMAGRRHALRRCAEASHMMLLNSSCLCAGGGQDAGAAAAVPAVRALLARQAAGARDRALPGVVAPCWQRCDQRVQAAAAGSGALNALYSVQRFRQTLSVEQWMGFGCPVPTVVAGGRELPGVLAPRWQRCDQRVQAAAAGPGKAARASCLHAASADCLASGNESTQQALVAKHCQEWWRHAGSAGISERKQLRRDQV